MKAFGEYAMDGSASTAKFRDYRDATDLVIELPYGGTETTGQTP
jgi:hypothetical protein